MLKKIINVFYKKRVRVMEANDINMEQLKKLLDEGAMLIDVRSPQEYREWHMEGSLSIPEYMIKSESKKNLMDKKQMIIVYCGTGNRSKRARNKLLKLGYENVYNLYQGFENY